MSRVYTAFILLILGLSVPAWAVEHPVPLEKDADCATCHEDKTKAPHVHSAIAMGCTTCHEVKTEGETTTVNLVAAEDQICFTCHEASKDEVKHGPYAQGRCTLCHDPHTSEYANQLRAEGNNLCLGCHAPKVAQAKVVLFQSHELSKDEFNAIPKIYLDPVTLSRGHPMGNHPVAGVADPRNPGEKIACLTCHLPHSGPDEKLLRRGSKPNEDVCASCHNALDEQSGKEAAARDDAATQKPRAAATAEKGKKKK